MCCCLAEFQKQWAFVRKVERGRSGRRSRSGCAGAQESRDWPGNRGSAPRYCGNRGPAAERPPQALHSGACQAGGSIQEIGNLGPRTEPVRSGKTRREPAAKLPRGAAREFILLPAAKKLAANVDFHQLQALFGCSMF